MKDYLISVETIRNGEDYYEDEKYYVKNDSLEDALWDFVVNRASEFCAFGPEGDISQETDTHYSILYDDGDDYYESLISAEPFSPETYDDEYVDISYYNG